MVGDIRTSNSGRKFEITAIYQKHGHKYCDVRFLESGYVDSIRYDSMEQGWVKDNLAPVKAGEGCVGYINTRDHWHEYKIWVNMIARCYDPRDKAFPYYGARGVTVCDRWKRFDQFFEDMRMLPGFDEELFRRRELRLDKDILSSGAKIYSPETCQWVSDLANQKQRTYEYNNRHRKYAIFPDGHVEFVEHMSDFCKEHSLHRSNVYNVLRGGQPATKGFRFFWEDDEKCIDYPVAGSTSQVKVLLGKDETPAEDAG